MDWMIEISPTVAFVTLHAREKESRQITNVEKLIKYTSIEQSKLLCRNSRHIAHKFNRWMDVFIGFDQNLLTKTRFWLI